MKIKVTFMDHILVMLALVIANGNWSKNLCYKTILITKVFRVDRYE